MHLKSLIFLFIFSISTASKAQAITQTIKGTVIDEASQEAIPFATIEIMGTDPILGTTTDLDGNFSISNVPIGRYDIKFSFLGFEPIIKPEVVVTSTREVIISIGLKESITSLNEVEVKAKVLKDMPTNQMATVSARMLSVEEANRYAGGFDDPARLAASFPGVASNIGNNAIVIRGNAPKFLQWKIEDIEIPNPNHFADVGTLGGGGITALSSNLLANSDFYTGAFPAEYNNALSGVFDIKMRNGNNTDHEHSIELGVIGLDFASEGPLSKKKNASYLFNYRYSTLGLISKLLPEDAQGTNYQDFSFKFKMPTKKAGIFSFWGIGLMDRSGTQAEKDLALQSFYEDKDEQDAKQYMAATGLNNRFIFKNSAYLNTTLAFSTNGVDLNTLRLDSAAQFHPENKIKSTNYNFTFKTVLNKKFGAIHTNKTGALLRGMAYNLILKENDETSSTLKTLVDENGFSMLASFFSNSSFTFKKWMLNVGVNSQIFTLNNHYTIEPRLGVSYKINEKNKLSFGYGLHSRIEPLNIYFANTIMATTPQANKDLDFSKANHLVLSYDWNITEKLHLKLEPYYQYLYNIPVVRNSTNSLLNLQSNWFIDEEYENLGKGQNYGLDVTLEQFINKGFYYLISGSIFNSKYKTNTDNWYNTRFNRNYLINFLIGKEFRLGKEKQSLFGLNAKVSLQGGDRYSIIDETASTLAQNVIYNETTPFTQQTKPSIVFNFTVNYEWYKKKTAQKLSFKILNASAYKEFQGHRYNFVTEKAEEYREALVIPNISYKISF